MIDFVIPPRFDPSQDSTSVIALTAKGPSIELLPLPSPLEVTERTGHLS